MVTTELKTINQNSTAANINENFIAISDKINGVVDELNYMNLFRLVGTTTSTTIKSDFAILNVNEGRIWTDLDSSGYQFLEETYKNGDYILKTRNGLPLKIQGPTSGAFKPQSAANGVLTWSYQADPGGSTSISTPLPNTSASGSNIYAQKVEISSSSSQTFNLGTTNAEVVPIITCYTKNSSTSYGPQIEVDIDIASSTNVFTINFPALSFSYVAIIR